MAQAPQAASGWRRWRPSATMRLAWGVLSLTISLLLVLDLLLGLFPSEHERLRAVRERAALSLATQVRVMLAQPRGEAQLSSVLDGIAQQSDELASLGVRRRDGALELRYRADPSIPGWRGWVGGTMLALMLSLSTGGLLVYYFYLRRMLQHLDPSQAIPERVRAAFDALAEGLLVLDHQQRIMLTNEAFSRLYPSEGPLLGKPVADLAWLREALGDAAKKPPWLVAMQTREPVLGVQVRITGEGGEPRHALMNCAAICDAKGAARGCVVTLDDVTELDRANVRLREAMGELERSHDRIQTQNVELEQLANHDPMTGCLNRRAFYARAEPLFRRAREQGTPLACIMSDIDKFKNFNDTHGHAVGDQVIQQVAGLLKTSLRADDLLCRYGGEEFCIVLPNTPLPEALRVAQRMRARMEAEAGPGVTSVAGLRITSSFGVCTLPESQVQSLDKLIEQADAGLYAAKEAGRNRVRYAPGVQAAPDVVKSSMA